MNEQPTSWLRENLFLVAAMALPVLIVVVFGVATQVPKWLVDPPQHDLLFVVRQYVPNAESRRYEVEDNRVVARPLGEEETHSHEVLYRFSADDLTVTAIDDPSAQNPDRNTDQGIPIAELSGLVLLENQIAPDGYRLDPDYRRRGGLVGELFGMGSHRHRDLSIENAGRRIELIMPPDHPTYYQTIRTLAWIQ